MANPMATASSAAESDQLPGLIEGLPNICGWASDIAAVVSQREPIFLPRTNLRLEDISAGFAIALHMHQPMIPAGKSGALVNNLQYMLEHPYEGDNYNAGHFAYCYGRIGDFIPELTAQGCNPRVMLDYTGTLLWGLQQMGRADILDKLKRVTCDEQYQPYVEWLGTFWGHSVADALPLMDIKLQIQAWQHHFAAIFGQTALGRVRGFSLPERQLPRKAETLYVLIKALKDCGYQWMMVPRESVIPTGNSAVDSASNLSQGQKLSSLHEAPSLNIPHRLVAHSITGEVEEITVFLTDNTREAKLVAKMQPYYRAKNLAPVVVAGKRMAPIITQIADGENEGLMMNEFPSAFKRASHEIRSHKTGTVAVNATEYLGLLDAMGIELAELPKCQMNPTLNTATEGRPQDVDGLQRGHRTPIETLSQRFHRTVADTIRCGDITAVELSRQHRYRNALVHNLLLQTSCFRSWGIGEWTDYENEIYRRGMAILDHDF